MAIYKVTGKKGGIRFAGSMAEVREAKAQLMAKFEQKKSEVSHEEVPIKSGKAGLLEALNSLSVELEDVRW